MISFRVLDALALVRLGRAERADLRGGEAEQVLVDPAHRDLRLLRVHLGGDALGELEDDRVREAEGEVDVLPLHLGLEADAADLEAALVALHDALDRVLDERAGEAVEAPCDARLVRPRDRHLALVHRDRDARVEREGHLALRALDLHEVARSTETFTFSGILTGIFPTRDMARLLTRRCRCSSPPTFCLRASRSTITPFDVERIAIPIPFRTRGIESVGDVAAQPGLRDALDVADRGLALGGVLEDDR